MADIPIQLKFFKKLELYQELTFQNKKPKHPEDEINWKNEKIILSYAFIEFHILGEAIEWNDIAKFIFIEEYREARKEALESYERENKSSPTEKQIEKRANHFAKPKIGGDIGGVMENLVIKGFVKYKENVSWAIQFTKEGLLMGEVIYDCEKSKKWLDKNKYPIFIFLTWATIISAIIITIVTAFNLIKGLLK